LLQLAHLSSQPGQLFALCTAQHVFAAQGLATICHSPGHPGRDALRGTPNSRDNSAGVRPAIASSTICCLNAAGYGGLVFPISDSFFPQDEVSAKFGQLQFTYSVFASALRGTSLVAETHR
jgi:hypothetical protein